MIKRIRTKFLVMLLIGSSVCLEAQKVGTSSLQFLKVMPTARATAMGDAYSALAQGSDAVFWNPAGVTSTEFVDLSSTFTLWLFDTYQSSLAVALPLKGIGTLGAQLQYVDYGNIPYTTVDQLQFVGTGTDVHFNPGLTGRTFSPSTYLVGLTYANSFTDRFSAGISVKYVHESLWDDVQVTIINDAGVPEKVNTFASLFLFDFGMQYNTGFRSIKIGVSVQNFGQQARFARDAFPAPLAFRIGAAANLIGQDAVFATDQSNRLTLAYDLFQPNDYTQQMHLGVEYSLSEVVALRAGYKFYYDNESATFGAGVHADVGGLPLTFDYSYGTMGTYLPAVHRISLGVQIK